MARVIKTRVVKGSRDDITVQETHVIKPSTRLTEKEVKARQIKKYATTTFGFGARNAFSGGENPTLFTAIYNGNIGLVQQLIDRKTNLNALDSYLTFINLK